MYRWFESATLCDNYVPQWWVEFDDELSWLFTNRFRATRYMKVKRMGITEILRRIWLFSANKIKSPESGSKQPNQLIVQLSSSLWHIIVTLILLKARGGQWVNNIFLLSIFKIVNILLFFGFGAVQKWRNQLFPRTLFCSLLSTSCMDGPFHVGPWFVPYIAKG